MEAHAVEKLPDPPEVVSQIKPFCRMTKTAACSPHSSGFLQQVLLPEGWKQMLPKEQHLWVSKALFSRDVCGKLKLTEPLQLWWSPPGPQLLYSQLPPIPDPFFHSRLFLWMPCRMWAYRLPCTKPKLPSSRQSFEALRTVQHRPEGFGHERVVFHGHGVPGVLFL